MTIFNLGVTINVRVHFCVWISKAIPISICVSHYPSMANPISRSRKKRKKEKEKEIFFSKMGTKLISQGNAKHR